MKKPGPAENLRAGLVAGGIAATAAAVSFYLARVFMSREWLEPLDHSGTEEDTETRTPGGEI
jgi:hypothetical protein